MNVGNEFCGRSLDVLGRCGTASGRCWFCGRAEVILKLRVFRRGRELLWMLMNIEQPWRLGRWDSVQGGWGQMGDSGVVGAHTVHQRLKDGRSLLIWRRLFYFMNGEKLHQLLTVWPGAVFVHACLVAYALKAV